MNFSTYLQSKGLGKETIKNYERYLLNFITWADKQNIEVEFTTDQELLSYVKYLQLNDVKQATIQFYLGGLKHYFNWVIKRELRKDNPIINIDIKGIKRRSLHTILSKQDLEELYNTYFEIEPKTIAKKRNEVILGLMVYQGLGSLELARLTTKNIKLREGVVEIESTRKTNGRTLKLEAHQVLDMMEYTLRIRTELLAFKLEKYKNTEQLFLSTGQGETVFGNIIRQLLKHLIKLKLGVTSVNQIRTSVITHWLKQYNLREVQYKAGHRYIGSTEAYLINDLDDLQEDINKYHPIG